MKVLKNLKENKKFKSKKVVFLLGAVMLTFTACGSSSESARDTDYGYTAAAYTEEAYDYSNDYSDSYSGEADYASDEIYESGSSNEGRQAEQVSDTSRKLIKSVNMSVETEDADQLINNVTERINSYGGYIEYSYIDNGSPSYKNYAKSGSLTIRIPADYLDDFLSNVGEMSNIISKTSNVQDVTLQYVDSEARRDSLKAEQQRLLELVEQADNVEEIIYIEDQLSEVRYELESIERQIRSYDNQVDYSTVNLEIQEVKVYTPVVEKTRIEELTEGFAESVIDVYEGILDFFVGLIVAIPYLIVWAIVILLIVLIIKAIIKKSRKNKEKRQQRLCEMQAQAWAQAQSQVQSQNLAQTQNQAQAQTQNQAQAQTQSLAQTQNQDQLQTQDQTQTQSQVQV